MPPITRDSLDSSIVQEMDRLNNLTLPDFGLHNDDIRYFSIDSVIQGKGPNRLKYLDLEGHWRLNGKSIPYISTAFNHLERMNDAQLALRIDEEPLNAIGMVGWTPSEAPPPKKDKKMAVFVKPEVEFKQEVPPSPREPVPHRSAGYGPAHQKRKLSVPDRSRSPTPRTESPLPEYDKYAKYQKDSISAYGGQKWGSKGDLGYVSAEERSSSATPSPRGIYAGDDERPPHRTPSLSPRKDPNRGHRPYDTEYDPSYLYGRDRQHADELTVSVKETTRQPPYRSLGYGDPHLHRQYDISPRSLDGGDYSNVSEQPSPYARNVDDVLVTTYHMTKTMRREQNPRRVNA